MARQLSEYPGHLVLNFQLYNHFKYSLDWILFYIKHKIVKTLCVPYWFSYTNKYLNISYPALHKGFQIKTLYLGRVGSLLTVLVLILKLKTKYWGFNQYAAIRYRRLLLVIRYPVQSQVYNKKF